MRKAVAAALMMMALSAAALASDVSSRVRTMVTTLDYEGAAELGDSLLAANADDIDLRAWTIVAHSYTDGSHALLDDAHKLTATHPESAVAWFAQAMVLVNTTEDVLDAEAASAKMMALAGDAPDPHFVSLRSVALQQANHKTEAAAVLDKALERTPNDATLLVAKASITPREKQMEVFEQARKADPTYVAAWARPGSRLVQRRMIAEGYPLLKQALTLSPAALTIHRNYWQAIHGLRDKNEEQKAQEIEEDMAALQRAHPGNAFVLLAMATEEFNLKHDEKGRALEERLIKDFPTSIAAEHAVYFRASRYRHALDPKEAEEPEHLAEYRRLVKAFIDYPSHNDRDYLGDAYLSLLAAMRFDRTVSDADLLAAVDGFQQYNTMNPEWHHIYVPIALADRGLRLPAAEALARKGEAAMRKQMENDRAGYETEGDYIRARDTLVGWTHDAIGWVLFKEGKLAEAKKELLAAREGDPKNALIDYHLGQYYESRKLYDKAEESYTKGTLLTNATRNDNPAALEALYKKRHGSLAGWESYRKNLDSSDSAVRKRKVLATRNKAPKDAPSFAMKTLAGGTMSLADLKGKVGVINFWGVWCGWCVKEMPEFQQLVKKYENDPAVRVITIDTDGDIDKVRRWMSEKKFAFPVLLDDGWVSRAGMMAFPSTWFLDRNGKIAFEKKGWSEKLVEEFSWRIEALKTAAR